MRLLQKPREDIESVDRIIALVKVAGVVKVDSHFSVPLHDSALLILLERKME